MPEAQLQKLFAERDIRIMKIADDCKWKTLPNPPNGSGSYEYSEGNASAIFGGILTGAGLLICLLPGGQGIGAAMVGVGLAALGNGVIERDQAYQNNPNYKPPQPPFNQNGLN